MDMNQIAEESLADNTLKNVIQKWLHSDIVNGTITDVVKLGVIESFNVKLCMVSSAAEAAEQILRVDNIIKCAPRPRPADHRPC
ncbi:hypothetical protein COOONC_03947 [Cooperia oncophora]